MSCQSRVFSGQLLKPFLFLANFADVYQNIVAVRGTLRFHIEV
jgi:hypothetical protein